MSGAHSAAETRRQAIHELADVAGWHPPGGLNPDRLRADSLRVLRNRALRRHAGDPAMVDHIWELMPLARGDAAALHDATGTHTGPGAGVPGRPERPNPPTVDEIEEALRG